MALEKVGIALIAEGVGKFVGDIKKAEGAFDRIPGVVGKAAGAVGTVFVAAAAAATAAVGTLAVGMVKLGSDGLKLAIDFQSQMATLSIAAANTGLSFDQLHDAALQVGGDTQLLGVSATGAADSMTGLYKAGLTTTEIFGDLQGYMAGTAELGGALRASIDLAAATELDMVQASDLAAIALASFGGELETEAERAEFINMAMNNMVKAADASVAEVSGLAEALKMVGPAAGSMGIGIETVNNALALLSTRGIQGSMAGTSLNRMLLDLGKTTPKATEMMAQLGISIYDVDGAMLPLVDIIGQFENALGSATDAERDAALQAIFTAQGARAMNVLLAEGVEGWNAMAEATAGAMGIQEQAAIKAETYAGKMEALEGTIETLKIQIGEALLPVATDLLNWFSVMVDKHGPDIVAIFQFIAASVQELIAQFREQWPTIKQRILEFWDVVQPILAQVLLWFQSEGPSALANLRAAFTDAWSFIQEQVEKVVNWFQENLPLIQQTGETLVAFWEARVVPALDNVWNIIKTIVSTAIDVVTGIITLAMQVITGDWEGAWESVKQIALTIWEGIKFIASEFVEGVANAVGTTTDEIVETWRGNWEMAKTIITTIVDRILDWLAGTVDRFIETGRSIVQGLIDGIRAMAGAVTSAISSLVGNAIDAAKSALGISSRSDVFVEIGKAIGQGLVVGIQAEAGTVQDAMRDLFGAAGVIGRLGGMAAQRQLDLLTKQISELSKEFEVADERAEAFYFTTYQQAVQKHGMFSPEASRAREELVRLQGERAKISDKLNDATKEQARIQEKLLVLEKQRQDLAFLQQQMKLLDLIREHGLDTEQILGGMELGINASLEGMVDAMSRALQAIIDQADEELGISSESRVFERIGMQIMAGLEKGITQQMPQMGLTPILTPVSNVSYSRSVSVTTGDINNGMDLAQLQAFILQTVGGQIQ